MSLNSKKALYAEEDGQFSVRTDLGKPEPGEGELLIETLYSGVNPADLKHSQYLGIRSTVLGYDLCGKVVATPSGSKFSKGDIVAGFTPTTLGRPSKYGTHQAQVACPEDMAFRIPSNLPQSHAAALTLAAVSAADALYNYFKLPLPTTAPKEINQPILIWGASSSVGICAVQFAKASGCTNILVSASPGRHELLKRLGATQCFDYSTPDVVSKVTAAVEQLKYGPLKYALDAVGSSSSPSSAELVDKCVPDPEAKIMSVVMTDNKRFEMMFAMKKNDCEVHPPGYPQSVTLPGNLEQHWHAWKALQWAVENYGSGFELPVVDVFEGTAEDALAEIHKVAGYGRGFGKLVLRHPLK